MIDLKPKKIGTYDKQAVDGFCFDDVKAVGLYVAKGALYTAPFFSLALAADTWWVSTAVFAGVTTMAVLDCTRPLRDGFLFFPPKPTVTGGLQEPVELKVEIPIEEPPKHIEDIFKHYHAVFSAYNIKASILYIDSFAGGKSETYTGKVLDTFVLEVQCGFDINKVEQAGENFSRDIGLREGDFITVNANIGDGRAAIYAPKKNRLPILFDNENKDWQRFQRNAFLPFFFGEYVDGTPAYFDMDKTIHLLFGGQTRSGKSIAIRMLIESMMMVRTPAQVRFTLHDPKRVELSKYIGNPYVRGEVTVEIEPFIKVLETFDMLMDARYKSFVKNDVVDIKSYNRKFPNDPLPYEVMVVEEVTSVIASKEVFKELDPETGKVLTRKLASEAEILLTNIARLGAGAGFLLVLGAQRFDSEVFKGQLRDNIPSAFGMTVKQKPASQVLIGHSGCEKLLRYGDALAMLTGEVKPRRLHGAIQKNEVPKEVFNLKF